VKRADPGRSASGLDRYLSRLEAELGAVPPSDRREILLETRSHVLDRTSRSPSRSVEEVLAELGAPEEYARQFLRDEEPAPPAAPRLGTLHRLARLAAGGWRTLPLLSFVLASYAIAVFAFAIGFWKLVEPDATGLWINDFGGGRRSVLLGVSNPNQKGREVLGYWLVLIAFGISVSIHLAMSALLRRVLRNEPRGY
jgi:hypothetical protein